MTTAVATTLLGLGSAAIWGAADFSGGMAARHLRVFWLLAISHAFSLGCLLLLAVALHQARPDTHILLLGLYAGIAGGFALLTFYHALSLGEMGTTAAISGLLTAALPVIFTLATIGSPSHRQLAGFALAGLAIWLISIQPSVGEHAIHAERKRIALAVISGLGFGAFLIFLRLANSGGLLWPLAASRVGSLSLALGGGLLFSRRRFIAAQAQPNLSRSAPRWKIGVGLAVLAGLCDTTGNFLFVAATRIGRLDIAAVLASLYPASTILLAAWLLKERTSLRQAVGMTAALLAVVLIA